MVCSPNVVLTYSVFYRLLVSVHSGILEGRKEEKTKIRQRVFCREYSMCVWKCACLTTGNLYSPLNVPRLWNTIPPTERGERKKEDQPCQKVVAISSLLEPTWNSLLSSAIDAVSLLFEMKQTQISAVLLVASPSLTINWVLALV